MIGAGVPASPVLEEEEGVGGSLIDGGSLLMEEGKSPVPVAADYLTQKVPAYLSAQVLGSMLASGTLRLLFNLKHEHYFGTTSTGSNMQSLVLEFIISFYLMFVISGVVTKDRVVS
ncbi:hypothetical protein MRB53_019993 [Persea americana]|uniref:Uncharacterized protein n=1 Tax=Persea americana TaxID=3435 RepID=A0ACC2KZX1_PERAE|nr:hypothetical protein MRB53_019993 [Persea americana]